MGLDIDLQGCSIRPLPTGPERMPHSRKQYQLACVTFSKNMWHALSTHTHTHTHTYQPSSNPATPGAACHGLDAGEKGQGQHKRGQWG